jgi:hypothetical protein
VEWRFLIDGEKTWTLREEDRSELAALFPGVDLDGEFQKMQRWLWGNPTKRKTARGMKRFLVNWLNRATPTVDRCTRCGQPGKCRTWQACTDRMLGRV